MEENLSGTQSQFDLTESAKSIKAHRKREEKRRRRELKFSTKKHPKTAIISFIFAAVSLVLLIISVVAATILKGEAGLAAGILTAFSFLLSLAGFVLAVVSFFLTDVRFRFIWIGFISNGVIWLVIAIIFAIGY